MELNVDIRKSIIFLDNEEFCIIIICLIIEIY